MLTPLLIALQFLTRVPVPGVPAITCQASGRSVLYYPLIGALLGAVLLLIALSVPLTWLAAALVLFAWVVISGALHLDGLADTADAWVGGHGDPHRTLEIMQDPRSGPMGVAAVVIVLLVKFAALAELTAAQSLSALLWVPILGRSAILFFALTRQSARPEGLATTLVACLPRRAALLVLAVVMLLCFVFASAWLVIILAALWIGMGFAMQQRVGGFTGDMLGAVVEVTETVGLCVLALQVAG